MTETVLPRPRLFLLRGFQFRLDDELIPIMLVAQRVVAFLAVKERPLSRAYVAGTLWPETTSARAFANLRSALWRLQRICPTLVDASAQHLQVDPHVEVDLRYAVGLAHRLLGAAAPAQPAPAPHELGPAAARQLSGDLLPDWEDDWVLMERERFRQIRLHALENLADRLIDQGSYGEAVDAAMAAVASEPLRETAQRTLIRAYLTEGNTTDAVRQYRRYERLLSAELGIAPSTSLRDLLYGRRRTEL